MFAECCLLLAYSYKPAQGGFEVWAGLTRAGSSTVTKSPAMVCTHAAKLSEQLLVHAVCMAKWSKPTSIDVHDLAKSFQALGG